VSKRGWAQVVAGVIAIGAGLYLLSYSGSTVDVGGQSGRSWFDIIDHGIGGYFVARGIWMLAQAGQGEAIKDSLEQLVTLGYEDRRPRRPFPSTGGQSEPNAAVPPSAPRGPHGLPDEDRQQLDLRRSLHERGRRD
jgi:hypothetical protein